MVNFHVLSARIGTLGININWSKVATEGIQVELKDVVVNLAIGAGKEIEHFFENFVNVEKKKINQLFIDFVQFSCGG